MNQIVLRHNRNNLISKFYTLFWIIYIPTCILFYNRMPTYIDEFMTLILVIFGLAHWNIKRNNHKIKDEYRAYGAIMAFYVIYSLILKINSVPAVFYDLQQQVRPYVVFYSTYHSASQTYSAADIPARYPVDHAI